ncbi:MarR family winged helix-turn-helix transcriptional regulator [Lacisediminihabitans sp.]|uniref:MarR family winged helix-turn-helix transcriptional regulator n=1 Tax=Lacisediminihabitans sp. TaxID=2787631 RepID=UPI00374D8CEC
MTATQSSALSLDGQICFALYNASHALTARYRELLDPLGVTYPQYLALLVLWESGPVTVSRLGERLHLDSGTLSPLLRRLEKAGLIARNRLPHNERSVEVSLTDAGSDLRRRAELIPAQVCAATGLRLDELKALVTQVTAVADHARASH